jgi:hypothetical protein
MVIPDPFVLISNIVPYLLRPPSEATPYRFPSVASTTPPMGLAPSVELRKLCRVVRVPVGVILKTVP